MYKNGNGMLKRKKNLKLFIFILCTKSNNILLNTLRENNVGTEKNKLGILMFGFCYRVPLTHYDFCAVDS